MKLHSEVDIDIETLKNAEYSLSDYMMYLSRVKVTTAVIKGLDPEDKKIFESYRREQDPTKGGE